MSEIVQFNLRRKDQMYGFLRFNEELKPYLPEIKQVNIELDEDNKPRTALNTIKAFYLNRGVVNHFTDPMLAFMGYLPGNAIISHFDAMAASFYSLDRLHYRINHGGYARFNGVITISERSKEQIAKYYHIPEENMRIVYCGVNRETFSRPTPQERETARKELCASLIIPEDSILLLNVGNPWPHKNLDFLIKLLAVSNLPLHLIHCGYNKDPQHKHHYDRLIELAQNCGAGHKYHQVGFVEDLPRLYATVDITVSSSFDEGFNLTPLEGAACGTPFIISDIPIHQEIYNGSGELVPFRYPEWSAAIKRIMDGDTYLQERDKLIRRFSWENAAKSLMDAYSYFWEGIK